MENCRGAISWAELCCVGNAFATVLPPGACARRRRWEVIKQVKLKVLRVLAITEREEYYEEDLDIHIKYQKEHPPCLLFLDSLKCHRKKKFTAMLREYLDSEWKNRHGSANEDSIPTGINDESIVMYFEPESITLLEPDMPMQTNSSDCGVFLLMYAAEVARRFPAGITQEDVETKFSATLTSEMFDLSHVQEFRDYLHQLIFCLHSLQKRGLSEEHVKDEELDTFIIER